MQMNHTANLFLLNTVNILRVASITELRRANPKVHNLWVCKVVCLLLVSV